MSRKVTANVINKMREDGSFRTDGFRLVEGFATDYEVKNVRMRKQGKTEEENAFNIECKSDKGAASISGFAFVNARMLSTDKIEAEGIGGDIKNIFTADSIQTELASSVLVNSKFEDNQEYEIPENIKVLGAMVYTDDDDKPLIPMSRYNHYQQCLNHHRKVVGDTTAFMTRDDFKTYLAADGDARPIGVPVEARTMALPKSIDAADPARWSYTLLVGDLK